MLAYDDMSLNRYGPGLWLLAFLVAAAILRLLFPPARDRWLRRIKAATRCNRHGDMTGVRQNVMAAVHLAQKHGWNDEVIESLRQLGRFHSERNELAEAEAAYREALVLGDAQLLPRSPVALQAWHELALVLETRGHHDEAEIMFQKMSKAAEDLLGPDNTVTAGSLQHLAESTRRQGRSSEADSYQRRANEMRTRLNETGDARKA
jgi:tetratricopeptide (TPR) repeat protein